MSVLTVARLREFHPPISDLLPNCEWSVNGLTSLWRRCQEPGTLEKPPLASQWELRLGSGTLGVRDGAVNNAEERQELPR